LVVTVSQTRDVHAAILAAGLSSRFGGAQKALYTIDGRSLLERSVRHLLRAGVSTVTVVCGHQAEEVKQATRDLALDGVTTLENENYDVWNNFYSVELACSEAPAGDLVVVNGDIIYIASALAAVLEPAAGDLFVGVADEEFDDEAMKVSTRGRVVQGLGKNLPRESFGGEFIGISRLAPAARRWYVSFSRWARSHGLTGIYYEDVYDGLCGGLTAVACAVARDAWAEIDAHVDLDRAQRVAVREP
jgi:choline kinase